MVDNDGYPKEARLLSAADFSYLRESPLSVKNKCFKIYFKNSRLESGRSRLGISVSKKVGKSHLRNLCKRHIREVFRTHPIRERGLDIIFIVSSFYFKSSDNKSSPDVFPYFKNSIHHALGLIGSKR